MCPIWYLAFFTKTITINFLWCHSNEHYIYYIFVLVFSVNFNWELYQWLSYHFFMPNLTLLYSARFKTLNILLILLWYQLPVFFQHQRNKAGWHPFFRNLDIWSVWFSKLLASSNSNPFFFCSPALLGLTAASCTTVTALLGCCLYLTLFCLQSLY